ncbi:uncharacterized protein LOC108740010 [Agrilus planipennis]|uniref:Uncharacterized protein LOC108740010 n=1 Tax=Agrilus planipennis TaxID=224129 RepID=A0A1W4X0K3_AGRPL|nr:uncharacterized protein LOC108740010 [Agrilus planipennis]
MEDSGIDSGDHNLDIDLKSKSTRNERLISNSDSSSAGSDGRSPPRNYQPPTTRQLQRKLESRIEHARRLHHEFNNAAPGLLPIQRLSIPGTRDHRPLVQWDSDDSEEDIVNFFPLSRKESRKEELTDTFSIEEMSISGDEEEEDLHLVPPQPVYKNFRCCPMTVCTLL